MPLLKIINTFLIRDDVKIFPRLLEDMFHSYIVTDDFTGLSQEDRIEAVGAYEDINKLILSIIENGVPGALSSQEGEPEKENVA